MEKRLEIIVTQEGEKLFVTMKRSVNLDKTTAKTMINKVYNQKMQSKLFKVLEDLPVKERDTFNG